MNRQLRRTQERRSDPLQPYRDNVAAAPRDAKARNELGCALVATGRLSEAAEQFAGALRLMPELLEQYAQIVGTVVQVNPPLRAAMATVARSWPQPPSMQAWLSTGEFAAIARDPFLQCVLELVPVRDLNLERLLTVLRREILNIAASSGSPDRTDKATLEYCCALARQCFLNEYVFWVDPHELKQLQALELKLISQLNLGQHVPAIWPVLLAAYLPLASFKEAQLLLDRPWSAPVRNVLRQQLMEPDEELRWRQAIPRLTGIEDGVSLRVQQQYEENPYPRWIAPISAPAPTTIADYLRREFPTASFPNSTSGKQIDILVAGCGTGQQSIATARRFHGATVLAVDLSMGSLAYARRMTHALGLRNIEYAQADILNLGSLGRTFDVIEASGVLHHMAQPFEGWRALLAILRPGGFMNVGLYSKTARRVITSARVFVAERGYRATAEDIRRARQDLLTTPMSAVSRWDDYYTTSECRDMLFHVQEHQTLLGAIQGFIESNGLQFVGMHVFPQIAAAYRARFPHDTSLTDLACWRLRACISFGSRRFYDSAQQ